MVLKIELLCCHLIPNDGMMTNLPLSIISQVIIQ